MGNRTLSNMTLAFDVPSFHSVAKHTTVETLPSKAIIVFVVISLQEE